MNITKTNKMQTARTRVDFIVEGFNVQKSAMRHPRILLYRKKKKERNESGYSMK